MKCLDRIQCHDKRGQPYEIRECSLDDFSFLMNMYDIFSPKPASQGLPPPEPETCRKWAKSLLEIATNLLAWQEDKVIGHAALIKDVKGFSGEFVIFVHQDLRNLGIGTELMRLTIKKAKELGFKSIWLTVAMTNFVAIRLYRKLGFEYSDMDAWERTMVINL
jgi:GNAT superfamily N-acetyltransferase